MNTKYKIGQTVFYMRDNQIVGRPIVQININHNGISYSANGRWFIEEDLFVNIDDLLNSLKENADIKD